MFSTSNSGWFTSLIATASKLSNKQPKHSDHRKAKRPQTYAAFTNSDKQAREYSSLKDTAVNRTIAIQSFKPK